MALADKVVSKEVEDDNRRKCSRDTNIQTFFRRREDGGLQ